jgi:intraflagellar transport protein 172
MRDDYFKHLLGTRQEEKAAALKEQAGDFEEAVALYLKGGLPAKAAALLKAKHMLGDAAVVERVAAALTAAGMHDRSGELAEAVGQLQRALDSYVKGHAYRLAVDLARRHFAAQVVELQEAWGDWLAGNGQVDMAVNHYVEAACSGKAIEAALAARQWAKAAQFVETLDVDAGKPYFKRIARHYEESAQLDEAERFYVAAHAPKLAVEMYTKLSLWDKAHKLATSYMSEREVSMLYISQAQRMEASGKLKEAEQLYVKVRCSAFVEKKRRFENCAVYFAIQLS